MASGQVNRIKRPDTWLHRPMLQNVKKALANSEPSTHGTSHHIAAMRNLVATGHGGHWSSLHQSSSIYECAPQSVNSSIRGRWQTSAVMRIAGSARTPREVAP
jgi:hypothetical protein